MPRLLDFIIGPWRAVAVLGVTQILAWGSLFYPTVLTVPLIAADRGWSQAFAMAGFSVGLFCSGLVSRYVGALIDRFGGHAVMPFGSLIGALGLVGLATAQTPWAYFGVWIVLGVAMAASLYDPAFATLVWIFRATARTPITALTLIAGFASTVSWPVTQFLIGTVGWRGAYLVYAALLAFLAAPLHAFALPRWRAEVTTPAPSVDSKPSVVLPPRGLPFVVVATAFASYAFVPSALSAQLLAIFERFGLSPTVAVAIGMLFGPAQVLARVGELSFARHLHPLWTARFAAALLATAFVPLALLPFSAPVAAAFAVIFGVANGLMTIARGTLPLALFGAGGYGLLVGRIAGPFLVVQSVAPVLAASVAEHTSDGVALTVVAAFAVASLICFAALRPRA